MEIFNHVSEYVVLSLIFYMKSVKHTFVLCYVMLFINLFSIRNLFSDIFISSECVAFDGSVISE